MAATTVTAAQLELISSLSQEELPIKLRCAICSRLAINAFRLPCCEQAICELCHSNLPSSCPVCEHTPVAAADCKPNKSLRTTIKVFLRTEEKKREALRLREEKNSPPETPVEAVATPIEIPHVVEATPVEVKLAEVETEANLPSEQAGEAPVTAEAIETSKDVPQQSIEEIAPGQESTANDDPSKPAEVEENNGGKEGEYKDTAAGHGISQTSGFGTGFGFDASAAGGFPNMPFGGDFNQMQMMMAMQNGINPATFGNFPMIGMPGMNMDPVTMQQMMMSGGFGGMNMGMGMGGFDGGVGAGFNNNWNGQQSWNIGQDNFNPNASSMGDFGGSNNSGYNSHAAGYNQGNYGRQNQYNDYSNNNYGSQGFRGRGGRGRGGYGRGGGYGQGYNEPFSNQLPQQFGQQSNGPISESDSILKGPKVDVASNVDEFGREIRPKSETKEGTPSKTADENAVQESGANTEGGQPAEVTSDAVNGASADAGNITMPIQTLDDVSDTQYGQGNGYNGYGGRDGYSQGHYGAGRGNFSSMQPPFVKPVDVPVNAPTGPKAMRQGLPNTSLSNLRSRGIAPVSGPNGSMVRATGSASASVAPEPSEKELRERDSSRSPSRNGEENGDGEKLQDDSRSREKSRDRDRKRSRSRERHRSSRRRERSHTPTEDDRETERRRERRRERRHREEEREGRDDEEPSEKEKVDEDKGEKVVEERSRSASPSESRRSSHHSRRDKDKYREREPRDSDREHKSTSHRHRSHRDRSRDRDKERGDRESHRHGGRHSHSRRDSPDAAERSTSKNDDIPYEAPTPIEAEPSSRKLSVAASAINGANGIEIKGAASSRRKNELEDMKINIPTGPRGDRTSGPSSALSRTSDREKSSRSHHDSSNSHSHSHRPSSSRHESSRSGRDRDREREKEKEVSKSAPAKDPHEIEREARNRERLLKEAQRIAGMASALGFGARKRSRDDGEEVGGKAGRRKKGRRGGGGGEDEEARITRLETEREGARWG